MVHLGLHCSQQISNANQRKMVTKDELFKLFPKLEEENEDDREEESKDEKSEICREVGKGVGSDKYNEENKERSTPYYEGVNPILLRWVINPDVL
jgi:hypothetical protein